MATWEPCYLETHRRGKLREKVEQALAMLASCQVCPRNCRINRLSDQKAVCRSGRYAVVGSTFPHFGEEDCLRGWRGSGTIFFGWCNLRCVFCQNFELSQGGEGKISTAEEIARMMLELQEVGCHNINFVTPEHVVPQVLEAVAIAVEEGLRLPLVYNTSAYDSLESVRLMDGVVDMYMPDFKFWDPEISFRLMKARNYPEAARESVREMHRQVGELVFDESGLARRGVLVRHLVMPGGLAGTREIMRFLAREVSPRTYVNIMDQYSPAGKADEYEEINRPTTRRETLEARRIALEEGITRFDERRPRGWWLRPWKEQVAAQSDESPEEEPQSIEV